MNKKIAVMLVTAVVAAILGWLVLRNPSDEKRNVTRIAANLPLSGPLAVYGVSVQEGVKMALDQENGLNAKFIIDWQDNQSDPKTAVTILQKQLLSGPDIYISGVKPQTMAIKDEVSKLGIPHFVWIFDAIINEASNNNLRTWVNYKIEPAIYAAFAQERQAKRIAITYVQLPHTIDEFNRIVIPSFRREGIEVLAEPYEFGRTDFKDIAAKLNGFKPDLIILNGFQGDLVGLVRSLRPLNAINDGNTIATYDLLDAANILGADEIEGLRVVAPIFETRAQEKKIAAWREAFEERYNKKPLYTHAFAYDMMQGIVAASQGKPSSHAEWIKTLRELDIAGATGPIRFDEDGDMLTPLEVGVYRNGVLAPEHTDATVVK